MYSVISPRGFASLLWKDPSRENEAANTMRLTARHVQELGICDRVIPEGGTIDEPQVAQTAGQIRRFFLEALEELGELETERLVEERYARYRSYGQFAEE